MKEKLKNSTPTLIVFKESLRIFDSFNFDLNLFEEIVERIEITEIEEFLMIIKERKAEFAEKTINKIEKLIFNHKLTPEWYQRIKEIDLKLNISNIFQEKDKDEFNLSEFSRLSISECNANGEGKCINNVFNNTTNDLTHSDKQPHTHIHSIKEVNSVPHRGIDDSNNKLSLLGNSLKNRTNKIDSNNLAIYSNNINNHRIHQELQRNRNITPEDIEEPRNSTSKKNLYILPGVLNFCIYFSKINDYESIECYSKVFQESFLKYCSFANTDYEMKEIVKIGIKIFFFLREKIKIDIKKITNPMIRAILDRNARVDGSSYSLEDRDMFLVDTDQIYNISNDAKILINLCKNDNRDFCKFCKKLNKSKMTLDFSYEEHVDSLVSQNDFGVFFTFLIHLPELRNEKYFKIVLKYFLQNLNTQLNITVLECFKYEGVIEHTTIAFIKALSNKKHTKVAAQQVVRILPCFFGTAKLVFASFTLILKMFNSDSQLDLILKNLVFRHMKYFKEIINLISVYLVQNDFDLTYEDLQVKFQKTNELFGFNILQKYLKLILVTIDRNKLSKDLIERNINIFLVKNIIDGREENQTNSVDIFVELLFKNGYRQMTNIFKPTVGMFAKNNLSHILFKIKMLYNGFLEDLEITDTNELCPRLSTSSVSCVFDCLHFIFRELNISVYFNYIWPYLEYFINKQNCPCCRNLMIFVSSQLTSQFYYLVSSYLELKYTNIEDIPLHVESKVFYLLKSYFQESNSTILSPTSSNSYNAELFSLYSQFRKLIKFESKCDISFISNFLFHYKNSSEFQNKIIRFYDSFNIPLKALMGYLKKETQVKDYLVKHENIHLFILENYLVRIDFERQDLYSFTIQEFLKAIKSPLKKDTEILVEQFRNTKFNYNFDIDQYKTDVICVGSYRRFLESVFYLSYTKQDCLKYLILFDDAVLESALFYLITDEVLEYLKDIKTTNIKIMQFIIKLSYFKNIDDEILLDYAYRSEDYYLVVYILEKNYRTMRRDDELQVAYYKIDDICRVRGFNSLAESVEWSPSGLNIEINRSKDKKETGISNGEKDKITNLKGITVGISNEADMINGEKDKITNEIVEINNHVDLKNSQDKYSDYSVVMGLNPLNLFFNFLLAKNYSAAKQCFLDLQKYKNTRILPILDEILHGKNEDDFDFDLQDPSDPILLHVLTDLEILIHSDDPLPIIKQRRKISIDPEGILRIHKFICESIHDLPSFTNYVDYKMIKVLRKKKEFLKAEELIAKLILQNDNRAWYQLCLIKMDQKLTNEANDVLKRYLGLVKSGKGMFKGYAKLFKISRASFLFKSKVLQLEDVFCSGFSDNNTVSKTKLTAVHTKLDKYKDIFHFIQKSNDEDIIKSYKYLQKIYFLTGKYYEKSDILVSLSYYLKSFNSNYEAIPRFFHLLPDISKMHFKIVEEMVSFIITNHISDLIPYFNQISNKMDPFSKKVLKSLLEKKPFETFWNSLILFNSKKIENKERMDEIIGSLNFENRVIFKNIVTFSEKLSGIARSGIKTPSVADFPDLVEFLNEEPHINIPGQLCVINSLRNEIHVFHSLQMPKKITMLGEDGIEYPMIVKSKDDLRKDSRFMDLNCLLNKLFKPSYYIRRYNIIPFTHDCGIIEFLPNLTNLKDIVTKHHDIMEGIYRFRKYKKIGGNNMKTMCETYYPVFNKYMAEKFRDPYVFYTSRENYIKTYAIMCIVGWFMGLGDRHTENIHFDNTGDTVHVDLNCIFEKGKTLEIPETVPFRLTQNIIDGFGRLGIEGTFKATMKYALDLLKENKDAVQANLLSFVFDPIFEWARKKNECSRIMEAMNHKLDFLDEEEKIEELIEEATDINNLGALYIGWMSFI